MDARRAEAMHGYFLAVQGLGRAESTLDAALFGATEEQGGQHVVRPAQTAFRVAMDEECSAVEECLAEGVTLVELDALAAMAGSRFAPAWARERYEVIG